MKRTFACGHTGKGQYCHACAAVEKEQRALRAAREEKRAFRRESSDEDAVDLSVVSHLSAVQREARELLAKVRSGIHPFALAGKPLKSTAGRLLSVPVGRSYRLLFDAPTLTPLRIVSHERYNTIVG